MKNLPEKQVIESLLSRYRSDPKGFRSYLPNVAQLLDAIYPPHHPPKSPFGLTERERAHHQTALLQVMEELKKRSIPKEKAVRGLEHCATLVQDDSLPEEVRYENLVGLLKAAIGKSPGSFKSQTIATLKDSGGEATINRISLIRGVELDLDRDMHLVAVTITPRKVKERRKLLRFVGLARDTASNVALRHDDYLAEMVPHASA